MERPPQREPEGGSRGGVHPLVVIDGEDQRLPIRENGQECEDRDAKRASVYRMVRLFERQRRFERVAARCGQDSQQLGFNFGKQVAQHDIWERLFGLRWTGDVDPERPLARGRHGGQPDGGLPDAGFTLQYQRPESLEGSIEERLDDGELGFTPDDRVGHGAAMFGSVRGDVQPFGQSTVVQASARSVTS
jgi:hypothetical protein